MADDYWIQQAFSIARDGGNRDTVERAEAELAFLRARVAELEAGQDEAKGFIEGLDVENNALRARVAELESMNKMLCGKLDDQRRALWDPCQPYLKDGETPAECIARNRRDVDIALSSLVRDRARVAEAEQVLADTLDERDQYHEIADKLADAIAAHFGDDIGEHSNLNCPWTQALELIESRASASAGGG